MDRSLPSSRPDPKDEIPLDRWVLVAVLGVAFVGWFLRSSLLLWSLGPGTVGVYGVGLAVGWVDTDGLRHAVVGGLFSVVLVVLGLVTIAGGSAGSLAFAATLVLEPLAVLAGAMALRAGRAGATDDPTARLRSSRLR